MEEQRIVKICLRHKMNYFAKSRKKKAKYKPSRKKLSRRESAKFRVTRQRGGAAIQAGAAGPSRQAPKQDVF